MQTWATRTQNFLTSINGTFFNNGIIVEPSCASSSCTTSQRAYKALLIRWLAGTAISAPFTTAPIMGLLSTTAKAVVSGCDSSGVCSVSGETGLGEQMTALDAVLALLVGRPAEESTSTTSSGPAATTSAKTGQGVNLSGPGCLYLTALSIAIMAFHMGFG